jgi:rod shape determining protein RodA
MTTRTVHESHSIAESFFSRTFLLDGVLMLATLLTVGIGIMMVHSTEIGGTWGYFSRQLIASAVGLFAMIILAILPYQVFRTYVRAIYIFMILFLLSVLVLGVNLRGTRGWFHLGPIYFQAVELAKITYVLALAGYLDQRIAWSYPRSLITPFLLAGFPILLILAQPDFSSSLVFFPAALVMFYFAGARTLHLLGVCLVGALATGIPLASTYFRLLGSSLRERPVMFFLANAFDGGWPAVWLFLGVCVALYATWWFLRQMRIYIPSVYLWTVIILLSIGALGAMAGDRALKDYQRKRLVAFVNPELDPLGGGYNVRQSQIAIGSGQVLGKGYGAGTQSRLGFLPSRHTDFIFSVIGEELGFIRALGVLILYFLIVWRGYDIAVTSRDRYGSLVAAGFATMFAFYALLNLGMTMGMAPVAGVPLPMVSYGGSSVVSSMAIVGIMLSIHLRRYLL